MVAQSFMQTQKLPKHNRSTWMKVYPWWLRSHQFWNNKIQTYQLKYDKKQNDKLEEIWEGKTDGSLLVKKELELQGVWRDKKSGVFYHRAVLDNLAMEIEQKDGIIFDGNRLFSSCATDNEGEKHEEDESENNRTDKSTEGTC